MGCFSQEVMALVATAGFSLSSVLCGKLKALVHWTVINVLQTLDLIQRP